jgi:hypothetical protein
VYTSTSMCPTSTACIACAQSFHQQTFMTTCSPLHEPGDEDALTPVSALAAILPWAAGGRCCASPTPIAMPLTSAAASPVAAGASEPPTPAAGRPAAGGWHLKPCS